MFMRITILILLTIILTTGCVSKLSSDQDKKYKGSKLDGALTSQEANGLAIALGLLPGATSDLYSESFKFVVSNFFLHPISAFWDSVFDDNKKKGNQIRSRQTNTVIKKRQ